MKKITFFFLLLIIVGHVGAQTDSARTFSPPVFSPEKMEVVKTVQILFDAMRAGDSATVRSVFLPEAKMYTAFFNQSSQQNKVKEGSLERFVGAVGTPHDEIWDEKIWGYSVELEAPLATVWTPYTFYLGNKLSHCGINTFLLFQTLDGWKIMNIADTRRTSNCQTEKSDEAKSIHSMLDAWHRAAAKADEEVFFGSMAEDGIYLGTDATERWLRDEMREWSEKYFERESAWDFKATKRHVYFSENEQMAWFEEELDTWMGTCRGSGLVQFFPEGWKIRHYNLALTVPNDDMKAVIEVIGH